MIISKAADVAAFLKALPAPVRVVLVYGPDRPRVRERADVIARLHLSDPDDPFSSVRLAASDIDQDSARLSDELTAQSLLGGKRLVRLRLEGEGRLGPALAQTLTDHADGTYNPDTLWLIESENLGKDSKLRQAAEKHERAVALPCYEADARDVATLVRQTLSATGVRLRDEAMQALLQRLPPDLGLVRAELDKLCLYAREGEMLEVDDIDALMAPPGEGDVFAAAFEAFSGQGRTAFEGLHRAFDAGEHPAMAARALALHALRLRRARAQMAEGKTPEVAAKAVGIFWKQEKAFLAQLNVWDTPALRQQLADIRSAEVDTKTTGQPAAERIERLVLAIARRARR